MNTRHIEQTHSEEFTSELFDIAYTDRAGDLVTSSLSKPYAEASGTEEVKGDFTSYITELPATLKVLIRRLFSAPAKVFGGKSMSQMFGGVKEAYDWLKERVKGSDGIPKKELPAVEDAAHLVENLRVLEERDMCSGADIPDGVSLIRMLASDISNTVTKIEDNNVNWGMTKGLSLSIFNGLRYISIGCSDIYTTVENGSLIQGVNADIIEFSDLVRISRKSPHHSTIVSGKMRVISMPKLKYGELLNNSDGGAFRGENLEEILMPKIESIPSQAQNSICTPSPKLKKVVFGKLSTFPTIYFLRRQITGTDDSCPNLIHIEFGDGTNIPLNLRYWLYNWSSTVMALRTDTDAEDYEDLRESTTFANNLEQFLYNFQTYIADRVADRTGQSALTITLSSAVYAALEAQEGQTILATLTSKNWTVASA